MNFPTAILGAILGLVGAVVIMFQVGATKADLQAIKTEVTNSVTAQIAPITTQTSNLLNSNFVKAEQLNNYLLTTTAGATYATKAEIPTSTKADLTEYYTKEEINTLLLKKANIAPGSTVPSTTPVTPEGAGCSYSVIGNPIVVSGATSQSFGLQITNNTASTRYAAPGFKLVSQYNAQTLSGIPVVNILSSPGGTALVYTPIPSNRAVGVTTIRFIPTGGGINNNGEFFVSPTSPIQVYMTVVVYSTPGASWTIVPDGSDHL